MKNILLLCGISVIFFLSCSKDSDVSGATPVQPPVVPGVQDDLNATVLDKIVTKSGGSTKVTRFSYDSQGRLIGDETVDSSLIISLTTTRQFVRDNMGRITRISENRSSSGSNIYFSSEYTDFIYTTSDGKTLKQSIRYASDFGVLTTDTATYTYNNNRPVEAKVFRGGGGRSQDLEESYRYSFDNNGNITVIEMIRIELTGYFAGENVGGWQASASYDSKKNPLYSPDDAVLIYVGTSLYGSVNNPLTVTGFAYSGNYSYEYRADGRPRKRTVNTGTMKSDDIYYYRR